jgi:hypothetical protein
VGCQACGRRGGGCQDRRHFSPCERFVMSKKRVVRLVSSFSRRETTWNCSLGALGNNYKALRLPVRPVVEALGREVGQPRDF